MKILPKKILKRYTQRAYKALLGAAEKSRGNIEPIDLLFAITRQEGSLGANILLSNDIKTENIKRAWLKKQKSSPPKNKGGDKEISAQVKNVLKKSLALASEHQNTYIGTEHLIGALMEEGVLAEFIEKRKTSNINNKVRQQIDTILTSNVHFPDLSFLGSSLEKNLTSSSGKPRTGGPGKKDREGPHSFFPLSSPREKSKTEEVQDGALDYFSEDLIEEARLGRLDPLIGREKEVDRLINILSRRGKNNPVLIGEAGVGKTAIVLGLAQKIAEGDVPEHIMKKRLLSLDLGLLIAGTIFRGEFEGRLKDVIQEAQAENAILFIDEIHTIIGAGAATGSLDVANMLKPVISRGLVQIIGATTTNEYRKHIEKDPALERRLQPIMVREPTREETFGILMGIKKNFEDYHQIKIGEETIEKTILLSQRFLQNRYFPDKAIDVLDEAAAKLRSQKSPTPEQRQSINLKEKLAQIKKQKEAAIKKEHYEEALQLKVEEEKLKKERSTLKKENALMSKDAPAPALTKEHIEKVVSQMAGVAIERISEPEKKKLLGLEKLIKKHIIGQDKAVSAVSSALKRSRSGIKEAGRPIGSFLFLGPSGVGKTELAKVLANIFFEDPSAILKIDMSEFSESHTVSKFLGAPAGYVGYEDSGSILDTVRKNPYSLILFDEIEKAHPNIHNLLLQILEDGAITSAKGIKVSFQNSLIVLTSNIGNTHFWSRHSLGFDKIGEEDREKEINTNVLKDVRKSFKPELVSRIDRTIIFNALTDKDIEKIIELEVKKLIFRLKEKGITLNYNKNALNCLAQKSNSRRHGARKVRQVVQRLVEDPLAQKIITGEFDKKKKVTLAANKNGLSWKITK